MKGYSDIESMTAAQLKFFEASSQLSTQDKKRVEKRRQELENQEKTKGKSLPSMMTLFPDLNLEPTSLTRRPYLGLWWTLYFVVALYSTAGSIAGFICSLDEHWRFRFVLLMGFLILFNIILVYIFYKKILHHPIGGYEKLVRKADYLSGNRGLTIFVKDRKFGLIKLWRCRIYVPAIYDSMKWETKDKMLRVKKDGREFLIDIYNNEI